MPHLGRMPRPHLEHVLTLLESLGTAGNLVTDAQIAALILESDAVWHTTDIDFLRFAALRRLNQLSGSSRCTRGGSTASSSTSCAARCATTAASVTAMTGGVSSRSQSKCWPSDTRKLIRGAA